ncbi:unnamed protein product [Brugia timori]|uniref:Uncharacterized protein n=1 Tax=Brugia timori TaxID=42155 RepID=A0A0R3Q8C0_9BILA|nr:unnamed protein product [Brugia timori]
MIFEIYMCFNSCINLFFSGFISGFLWGLYMSFLCFLYFFVSGPVNENHPVHSDVVLNILDEFKEQKTSRNKVYKVGSSLFLLYVYSLTSCEMFFLSFYLFLFD